VEKQTVSTISDSETVALAQLSPIGHDCAFVDSQDLFLWLNGKKVTVTTTARDSNKKYFNGIGDWVYQEEVFGDQQAMWYVFIFFNSFFC
jgi:dipeptidyl aminopeptidase